MTVSKKHIPNLITGFRILAAIALLAVMPFSVGFYVLYTLCGLSDVLDGFFARRFHAASETGAVLDSIADLLFYTALLYRLLPYLWVRLPVGVWYAAAAVIAIRLASYITAAIKYHRFASLHTYANKLTGFALFLIPYTLHFLDCTAVCAAVCTIGGLASAEELLIHLINPSYVTGTKTIIRCRKSST